MNIHKNTGLTPLGRERIFCAWARRQHLEVLPPDPQTVGLYMCIQKGYRRQETKLCGDDRAPSLLPGVELYAAWRAARSKGPPYRHRARRHP